MAALHATYCCMITVACTLHQWNMATLQRGLVVFFWRTTLFSTTVFSLGIKGLRGIVSTPRGRVGGVGDRLWEHNISWMIKLIPQTHLLKINSEFKSQRSSLKHDNSRIVSISNWYHGASQWPQPRDEGQRSCFLKISWIFKFIAHI